MLGWFNKKKKINEDSVPDSVEISSEELKNNEDTAAEVISDNNRELKEVNSESIEPVEQVQLQENQKGLLTRLQEGLAKTRNSLVSRVDDLFLGKKEIDAELLDELEEILITADLGVNTTLDLLDEIRIRVSRKELKDPHALKLALKEKILTFFEGYEKEEMQQPETGPFVNHGCGCQRGW
jgi:fused signal recognition particle receptor